jgi:hypothetical protein
LWRSQENHSTGNQELLSSLVHHGLQCSPVNLLER